MDLPGLMPWFAKKLAAPLGYDNKNVPHYPPPFLILEWHRLCWPICAVTLQPSNFRRIRSSACGVAMATAGRKYGPFVMRKSNVYPISSRFQPATMKCAADRHCQTSSGHARPLWWRH